MATKCFVHNPLTTGQLGAVSAELRGELPDSDGQLLPAYPVYALMVEFLETTGLRSAENAGLEIRDIRFSPALEGHSVKGSVCVERTKTRVAKVWTTGTPKSERSTRTVPLPDWLAAKVADYLATDHPRPNVPKAPLWPSRKNGGGYRAKGVRYAVPLDYSQLLHMDTFHATIFKPALAAAGLPVSVSNADGDGQAVQGVRLHDLRHTAAYTWLGSGTDFRKVSQWLGHADHTVTLMVYSDLIKGEAAESENPAPEPKSITNVVPLANRTG